MRHTRAGRLVTAGLTVLFLAATACAPLPATGPRLATGDDPRSNGETGTDDSGPPERPEWLAPESEPEWVNCGDRGISGIPETVTARCGLAGQSPSIRLSSTATPDDAAPLVVVTGPETPASELAPRLVASGTELVDSRPLVVVDHRGRTDAAGACLTFAARRTLDGLADAAIDPGSPELRGELADTSQSCTDELQGRELDYGAVGAAQDLEVLRQHWDVPGLAILGIGTGTRTALAYSSTYPDRLSLLALDSPAPDDGDQEGTTRAALAGSDAALRVWASSCTRPECGPGDADQKVEAVSAALDSAREPLADIPAALLSDVVRSALGDLSGASAPEPSGGDIILGDLVTAGPGDTPESVRGRAETLSRSSLPYVAGCSDLSQRVPVSRVEELEAEWADTPPFGEILAAQLSACSTWPVPAPMPLRVPPTVPVLLLAGIADPVAGAAYLEPTAGRLTAAGATEVRTVSWGAPGSAVMLHSGCAREALTTFLDDPAAAEKSTACPS
ncbi:alpha/beta hydrolase [uncultured Dietzia sp.]|uniref:alpha/beta hydrolase n=1 Tax=uncultured Dietzia sp. TaxID=395519 RepID=UPI0025DDC12E|nr:alpha/beta hydrolase [uncultured Dietzia sp.]